MGSPVSPEKYPFLSLLFGKGISELYEVTSKNLGFRAFSRYMSKCHLYLEIRKFLVLEKGVHSPEL